MSNVLFEAIVTLHSELERKMLKRVQELLQELTCEKQMLLLKIETLIAEQKKFSNKKSHCNEDQEQQLHIFCEKCHEQIDSSRLENQVDPIVQFHVEVKSEIEDDSLSYEYHLQPEETEQINKPHAIDGVVMVENITVPYHLQFQNIPFPQPEEGIFPGEVIRGINLQQDSASLGPSSSTSIVEMNNLPNISTTTKRFVCEICGVSYNHKSLYQGHMRTHTGEKPYKCEICEKSFHLRFVLTKHIRTHSGEKPYSCSICDQKFTQKYHKTLHERHHRGEKPYSCTICDKSFVCRYQKKRHMEKTHIDRQ